MDCPKYLVKRRKYLSFKSEKINKRHLQMSGDFIIENTFIRNQGLIVHAWIRVQHDSIWFRTKVFQIMKSLLAYIRLPTQRRAYQPDPTDFKQCGDLDAAWCVSTAIVGCNNHVVDVALLYHSVVRRSIWQYCRSNSWGQKMNRSFYR